MGNNINIESKNVNSFNKILVTGNSNIDFKNMKFYHICILKINFL